MSENVISKETTYTDNYLLEEPSLYSTKADQNTIVIKPLPNNVNIEMVQSQAGNIMDMNFKFLPTTETFINNGVVLRMKVPLKITRTAAIAGKEVVNQTNYVENFFNNYSELALRQYGLLNMIDTMVVRINGDQITSVDNIMAQAQSIYPYYNDSDVDEFFDASIPDRFQKYAQYDGTNSGIKTVEAFDTENEFMYANALGENDENIFRNSYKKGYNTRKPMIVMTSYETSTTTFTGYTILETFLPFSVFGLTDTTDSLYGIHNLNVSIKLKSEPVAHLFSTKAETGSATSPYSSLSLSTFSPSEAMASLFIRTYMAPDYITHGMMVDNKIKPYKIIFSETECMQNISKNVAPYKSSKCVLNVVNSETVPKSIYISAIRAKSGDSAAISLTPSVYGRISKVTISMGQIRTSYVNDSGVLYDICKGNGLNLDKEAALFTSGFPLKFNVSTDLSAAGTNFVGAYKSSNIQISFDLTNLDDVAHDYDIFVTMVFDSYIMFDNGKFKVYRSLINDTQLSTKNFAQTMYADRIRSIQMIGGSWLGDVWGKVKKGASKAIDFYKENKDTINAVTRGVLSLLKGSGQLRNISGGSYDEFGGSGINPSNQLGAGNYSNNTVGGKNVKSIIFK